MLRLALIMAFAVSSSVLAFEFLAETFTASNIVATTSLTTNSGATESFGGNLNMNSHAITAMAGLNLGHGQDIVLAAGTTQNLAVSQVLINVDTSVGQDIGGFAYAGGNVDGQILIVLNTSTTNILSLHSEEPGSTNLNRIGAVDSGAEAIIASGAGAILRYYGSGTTGRWRIITYMVHV